MSVRTKVFWVVALVVLLGAGAVAQAQSEEEFTKFSKGFSIDRVSPEVLRSFAKTGGSLRAYLLCVAAVKDSVKYCDYLNGSSAKRCVRDYKLFHQVYRGILKSKTVSPSAISIFGSLERQAPEEIGRYLNAFKDKDDSICRGKENCIAFNKRDPNLCDRNDASCSNRVQYIRAIEAGDVKMCGEIKEDNLFLLCRAGFNRSEHECKDCSDFEVFIRWFYDESGANQKISRKATGEGS